MVNLFSSVSLAVISFSFFSNAQLSGRVGPTTTRAQKAAIKVCNVLNYGAKADSVTDVGAAINAAWAACQNGGVVYIPPGTYAMTNWVNVKNGKGVAIQLDGTIVRTGSAGGNMIGIQKSSDFEFFSGNSQGAIQGYGYQYISQGLYGARFIRLTDVTDFAVHGFALVDSPSYYMVYDNCVNGEIYNLILRGIKIGMTDGIDIWGSNVWVHDVEVTNGDECVTVKSPAKNILIENVHCNQSGGCSIGSLGLGTSVSNIEYRNIYTNGAGGSYIKSYGGTGLVENCKFSNFILQGSPYSLTNNAFWNKDSGGVGIQFRNLEYNNFRGFNVDNSRAVVRYQCPDTYPCYNITLNNINLWTSDGNTVRMDCMNAYGKGGCLKSPASGGPAYVQVSTTIKTPPANWQAPKMPNDHASPFPSTVAFTIPPVPTTFYPSLKPISALLALKSVVGAKAALSPVLSKRALATASTITTTNPISATPSTAATTVITTTRVKVTATGTAAAAVNTNSANST